MSRTSIGTRVLEWRGATGMTQQTLAELVAAELGRSYTRQMVSKIENGADAVEKRSVLIAFARALGVSVTALTGQPYPATSRSDLDGYVLAEGVRAALEGWEEPVAPRPIEQLVFSADQSMAARMACDLRTLSAHLPDLIVDARTLYDGGDERAGKLLVQALVTGSLALKPAGWVDLAIRMADMAVTAAEQIGDVESIAWAKFARAQCALAAGARLRSYNIATGAMEELGQPLPADLGRRSGILAAVGMLNLHAALTAASLHRGDDAETHLTAAADAARWVEGDPMQMEFSPANVDTWRVGVALENGEAERAPELAARVDISALRTRQRRARLHMDRGRGLFIAGRNEEAVRAFLSAEAEAPGDLRNRPSAVEIVGQMVRDAPVRLRGGSTALAGLAQICGVDPLSPPEQ